MLFSFNLKNIHTCRMLKMVFTSYYMFSTLINFKMKLKFYANSMPIITVSIFRVLKNPIGFYNFEYISFPPNKFKKWSHFRYHVSNELR